MMLAVGELADMTKAKVTRYSGDLFPTGREGLHRWVMRYHATNINTHA